MCRLAGCFKHSFSKSLLYKICSVRRKFTASATPAVLCGEMMYWVMLLKRGPSICASREVVSSDSIFFLSVNFNGIVVIYKLLSWQSSHCIWSFLCCDLYCGQIMAHNAMDSSSTTFLSVSQCICFHLADFKTLIGFVLRHVCLIFPSACRYSRGLKYKLNAPISLFDRYGLPCYY